jgi:hypothetical protein
MTAGRLRKAGGRLRSYGVDMQQAAAAANAQNP